MLRVVRCLLCAASLHPTGSIAARWWAPAAIPPPVLKFLIHLMWTRTPLPLFYMHFHNKNLSLK
jgi:hypothetical protein